MLEPVDDNSMSGTVLGKQLSIEGSLIAANVGMGQELRAQRMGFDAKIVFC